MLYIELSLLYEVVPELWVADFIFEYSTQMYPPIHSPVSINDLDHMLTLIIDRLHHLFRVDSVADHAAPSLIYFFKFKFLHFEPVLRVGRLNTEHYFCKCEFKLQLRFSIIHIHAREVDNQPNFQSLKENVSSLELKLLVIQIIIWVKEFKRVSAGFVETEVDIEVFQIFIQYITFACDASNFVQITYFSFT